MLNYQKSIIPVSYSMAKYQKFVLSSPEKAKSNISCLSKIGSIYNFVFHELTN